MKEGFSILAVATVAVDGGCSDFFVAARGQHRQ